MWKSEDDTVEVGGVVDVVEAVDLVEVEEVELVDVVDVDVVDILAELVAFWPNLAGIEIASDVPQHAVFSKPQHQYSESSVPSQGVICAVPLEVPF